MITDVDGTNTLNELLQYTFTYYRQFTTYTMSINIVLDPACDDTDGVVSLSATSYSMVPTQTQGSLTFTIELSQPDPLDIDSTETVTLKYIHGTHEKTVEFKVYYNGCGLSYFSDDRKVGPVDAYITGEEFQY